MAESIVLATPFVTIITTNYVVDVLWILHTRVIIVELQGKICYDPHVGSEAPNSP